MKDDTLLHYGIKRRSGRYPWGSGDSPYQRSGSFLNKYKELSDKGMSETEIAKELGITTTQLRIARAQANEAVKEYQMETVRRLREKGMTNTDIAKELEVSEGTVRNLYKQATEIQQTSIDNTADVIKKRIDEIEYLDVGPGVERQLGISKEKLKAARAQLLEEGYYEHEIYVPRLDDPTKWTIVKVITKEADLEVVKNNRDMIRSMDSWTDDGGQTWRGLDPSLIKQLDSKKIQVAFKEDGGDLKDGLIEIRRGAEGFDLGNSTYAQVRIAVDGTHYLKGMAILVDDLPKGVDVRFNTNKNKSTGKMDSMKMLKDNAENPFGTSITRQSGYLNIVNEEGDWYTWSKTLSSQFLSKQPLKLVKDRINATMEGFNREYNEIMSLTNSAVRKHLLEGFVNDMGAKAKHLKLQGLSRTESKVLIPFPDMKPNEIYAPNYKNGERVVLVRHPHGGTFEIPELVVNNRFGIARKLLGNALDAVGIHPSTAERLSGADFDGDTVLVIPNDHRKVKSSRSLTDLKNFDPMRYKVKRDTIDDATMQREMGVVSNLITDMTIKDASSSELARAVKHSMVVIDSKKHKLDYKASERDNGINALRKKYQTRVDPETGKKGIGASTLISRSKKESKLNPGEYLVDQFDDARALSSGSSVENAYASYINQTKVLQNKAAKSLATTKNTTYNKQAASTYSKEVKDLDAKLNKALLNAPKERQAQLQASNTYWRNLNPDMGRDDRSKLKSQSLEGARRTVGSKRENIQITDREWEAIQAGAISNNKLTQILRNTDMDRVKKLATPKADKGVSQATISRARSMLSNGNTYEEVAQALGISTTTIRDNL